VGNNNMHEYVDRQVSGEDLVSTATRSLTLQIRLGAISACRFAAGVAVITRLQTRSNFARRSILTNDQQPVGYYGLDRRETEPRQRERLPTASAVLSAKVFCPSDDLVIGRTDRVATKVCEAVCAVFYLW
jgi:hypothetical protein